MSKFDVNLVGKVGSIALINKKIKDIDYNIIAQISRDLVPGNIWVTSGATEIGRLDFIRRNGYELPNDSDETKTDYSAQGQSILMAVYRQFINPNYSVRQILVEHQHFNDPVRREYLKNTLLRAKSQKAIPIINYNDPVSSDEIVNLETRKDGELKCVQGLDNDETASQIAVLLKAKTLLILTSVDGIYRDVDDPSTLIKEISGKNIYEVLENIDYCKSLCRGSSRKWANGAGSKLEYIKAPVKNGTEVFIANSKYRISEILSKKVPSTHISVK